jgi:hypothetical protein
VAKVAAFEVPGLALWFNSNDHLPPHFHAEQLDDWEVRVRFLQKPDDMIQIVWGTSRKRALRSLCLQAEAHREQLFQEWREKVAPPDPGPER